jgi:hypothetical protein
MDEKLSGRKWWLEEYEAERHAKVFARFKDLLSSNDARLQDNLFFTKLYGGRGYDGLTPRKYASASFLSRLTDLSRDMPMMTYNLIQSVIDTKVAKLSSTTPRCMYLTEGGNWEQQRKAKLRTKVADGIAYETRLIAKELDALLDEEVDGTGVIFVYEENGKACAERVLSDEILVDNEEAFYGEPRAIMRYKSVAREVLAELWPDSATEIGTAQGPDDPHSDKTEADLVLVVSAWHLPSGPDAGDGRWSICISNATLQDEEYKDEEFPFAFLIGQKRRVGFWGQGAAERLAPTQYHLNELYETIENQLKFGAVTRVLKRRGAKVPDSHIRRRRIGIDILEVDSPTDVTVIKAEPVSQQLLDRESTLIERGYRQEGVSEMDASAKKPAGLDSAPAQREYHDIASQRFMRLGKALEQFHLDCVRLLLKCAARIAQQDAEEPEEKKKGRKKDKEKPKKRGYKVRVPGKQMEVVDLLDAEMAEDGYIMKAYPVSALPTTPAAKREEVSEWIKQDWVDARVAKKLLDFPDLEDNLSLEVAAYEDIEAAIFRMLEKGDGDETPEPFQDLQLGLTLVQMAYLKAKREGAPDERLQLLRDWMAQAKALVDQAAPPPAAAPVGPPGAPPMPPGPPGAPPMPPGMPPA